MKDWFNHSLSRIFRRAVTRDRMLADLYVALRLETYSDLVMQRAKTLADRFHDSSEVGQCIGTMLDYIQDAESSMRAIEMSKYILRSVREGPVFDVILSRIGQLHYSDSIDLKMRKETARILNRLRVEADPEGRVLDTLFCFKEPPGPQANHISASAQNKSPRISKPPDEIIMAIFLCIINAPKLRRISGTIALFNDAGLD